MAVQGFGNVGGNGAAEMFVEAGAKVVAVQDHTGTIPQRQPAWTPALLVVHAPRPAAWAALPQADAIE